MYKKHLTSFLQKQPERFSEVPGAIVAIDTQIKSDKTPENMMELSRLALTHYPSLYVDNQGLNVKKLSVILSRMPQIQVATACDFI